MLSRFNEVRLRRTSTTADLDQAACIFDAQCCERFRCFQHRTLHFVQHVLQNFHEHFVVAWSLTHNRVLDPIDLFKVCFGDNMYIATITYCPWLTAYGLWLTAYPLLLITFDLFLSPYGISSGTSSGSTTAGSSVSV